MIDGLFHREQGGVDALVEGYYLIQRRSAGRMDIPVWIRFGFPPDPDDEDAELDRSPRWMIDLAGYPFDGEPVTFNGTTLNHLNDFWPRCALEPITASEYRYRLDRQDWAAEYDPFDPFGSPGGKIDPLTATLPFSDEATE